MADPIRRLQSGNVQLTGVSNLPQPNMNFGTQRPEIAYQAQADASSTVGRVIANLSVSMFGQAEKLAEAAGAQFIAENPITQKEIDAMVNGDTKTFSERFTQNAFGAAVNKWRSHELAAYFELQTIEKANDYQIALETGKDKNGNEFKLTLKEIAEDWKANTDGNSAALAQFSPDASYKYRATAAVHGNKVLVTAAKMDSERKFLQNQVYIERDIQQFGQTVRNTIETYKDLSPEQMQTELTAARQRLTQAALVLGGIPAQKLAIEKSAEIELEVKTAMFQKHIFEGNIGDSAAFMQKIRDGKLPPSLQNIWNTMSPPEQRKVRDAIDSEITALIKRKEDNKKVEDQETNQNISFSLMTLYDPNSKVDAQLLAKNYLTSIVLTRPDLMSAKTYADTLKSLEQDAVDDYQGLAEYDEWLRNNSNTVTAQEALQKGIGLRVTPKTAIEKFEKYTPKDAKERKRLEDLFKIETKLRSKEIKKGDLPALEKALKDVKLTLADAPADFNRLLYEDLPATEIKTNRDHFAALNDAINDSTITTATGILKAIKSNKYVLEDADYEKLVSYLNTKKQADNAALQSGANRVADITNSKVPATRAENVIQAKADIDSTFEKLQKDFKRDKFFVNEFGEKEYRAPKITDAENIVSFRTVDSKRTKQLKEQRDSLASDYGPNPTTGKFSESERKKGIKLLDIIPTFKAGDPPKADQNYIDKVTREYMRIRGIADPNKLTKTHRMEIQEIIEQQEAIAKKERQIRGR
jgi:hypothetical protein